MALAVVTGASGLLGSNLLHLLPKHGYDVRGVHRRGSSIGHLRELKVDWRKAELSDAGQLERAFAGASVVFHCAASVVQSRWLRPEHQTANIDATLNVLEAVRRTGVSRLVHCSSVVTCAISTDGQPVDEEAAWNLPDVGLRDGYSRSKRAAEEAVFRAARDSLDAVVVNPGYMIGPFDSKPSSGRLILEVARGRVIAWTHGCNNFVDVRDVATGMMKAAKSGRSGERYILGGTDMSYRSLLTLIASVLGVRPPLCALPPSFARIGGWAGDLIEAATGRAGDVNTATARYANCPGMRFSSDKAARELGYTAGPLRTAVEDAVTWFQEAEMLPRRGPLRGGRPR